jgi:phage regulator Rha-like protein
MNDILAVSTASLTSMTSREIAELTGKEHKHVLRDIRVMFSQLRGCTEDECRTENLLKNQQGPNLGSGISATQYGTDNAGRPVYEYVLDRDATYCLVTGYDANARMRIIKRWQELEASSRQPVLPQTYKQALIALVAEIDRREEGEAQLLAVQPAVQFHDEVAFHEAVEFMVRTAAKTLFGGESGGERKLVDWLLEQKWITISGGPREATAYACTRGLMRQRIDVVNGQPYQVAVLTGKGMAVLRLALRDGELFTRGVAPVHLALPGTA